MEIIVKYNGQEEYEAIVRCKDCVYCPDFGKQCPITSLTVLPENYCSFGVHKEIEK